MSVELRKLLARLRGAVSEATTHNNEKHYNNAREANVRADAIEEDIVHLLETQVQRAEKAEKELREAKEDAKYRITSVIECVDALYVAANLPQIEADRKAELAPFVEALKTLTAERDALKARAEKAERESHEAAQLAAEMSKNVATARERERCARFIEKEAASIEYLHIAGLLKILADAIRKGET